MPTVLEAPPSPLDVDPRHGWDGGRWKPPWQLWLALLLLGATAVYVSWLGVRAFRWQPVATLISVTWAIASIAIAERRFYVSPHHKEGRIAFWCLMGGFVAQAAQILVDRRFAIGPLWITIGILGIGGGFGVGSMALARAWFLAFICARLLFR